MDSIDQCVTYSNSIINKLRKDFTSILGENKSICILTTGSFARKDASEESDLDCYIIDTSPNKDSLTKEMKESINSTINALIKKDAGDTNTFGQDVIITPDELMKNIGGKDDNNATLTRRMLFLLEGEWLYNKELFDMCRKQLIETYIKTTVSDHQLSRFLLNDIIRYYRTITTDFQHKVSEGGKDYGVRSIKLIFSRKLLYFGGIITVAQTAQQTRNDKVQNTLTLFNLTPVDRIKTICGTEASSKSLKLYDYFLENISKKEVREELDKTKEEDPLHSRPEKYREMKNQSKHFSWALASLLKQTFDEAHPIHHALVF